MKQDEHLAREMKIYGTQSPEVHKELDEFYSRYGYAHRRFRHHLEYVLEKAQKGEWNSTQCRAAILHIMDDDNEFKLRLQIEYI